MPRPTPATWVFLALAAALFLISRTSGAGWILVIMAVLVALLATNAMWSWVVLRSVHLTAAAPRDAMVGEPLRLTLTTHGLRSIVRLELEELRSGTVGFDVPAIGEIEVVPTARGVLEGCVAIATCDAPFGLALGRRRILVRFQHPIEVAPRPIAYPLPASLSVSHDGDGAPQHRVGDGDVVRSLREYTLGDAPRLIHWAASARAGDLRVKELEPPDHPRLEVLVDVSHATGERAASQAAGLIRRGLNAGLPVVLHTHDLSGPVSGPVGSALEAGRRLARAIPGRPAEPRSPDAVRLS